MDLSMILVFAGATAAAFFGSKLIVAGDNRVEDRRRQAVTLSAWCAANGLPTLSSLCADYSVGDYSGVLAQVRQLCQLVADPEQSKVAVQQFLDVQLNKVLSTEEGKASLIAKIESKLGVVIDRDAIVQKPVELTKPTLTVVPEKKPGEVRIVPLVKTEIGEPTA